MKKTLPPRSLLQKITYYVGNALILLSLFGLLFTFYPIIQLYLFPPQAQTFIIQTLEEPYIQIDKINALAPIIEQVDPWNEAVYQKALKNGVAHAKGSSLPGQKGTVFLFAHSSGSPWELTRYNTVFFRLSELEKGDTIIIGRQKKRYTYSVTEKKEVWPTEVSYLKELEQNQLIVQTCVPIGTSLKRLLIFASPK